MSHSNNRSLRVSQNTLRHLFPARQHLFFCFLPAFLSLLDIFTVDDCTLMLISPISIFSAQSLESVHRSSKCVYEFIGASMGVYNISKEKKIKSKFLKRISTFDVQLHQRSCGLLVILITLLQISHEPSKQPKFKGLPKHATTFIPSTAAPLLSFSTCLPFSSRYFPSRRLHSYVDFTNLNIFRSISRKCS